MKSGLLGLVDNLAGSFYLTEEGEMRGGFVLFEGKSERLKARVATFLAKRQEFGLFERIYFLEIVGDYSDVNIAPFVSPTVGIGAV